MTHPALEGGVVYLDYNATTPVDPESLRAALPYMTTHFGNPSSGHHYAGMPRQALNHARGQVARLLGAASGEVVFTSGGSEADTLAILGAAADSRGRQIITLATEHPAVLRSCDSLRAQGFTITPAPVDCHGRLDPGTLRAAVRTRETALVSIAYGNGETGTLQPIAELAAIAHEAGALFHTDAAQAVGKITIDVTDLDVDLLTVAGHKMYAPKGVGALYVRSGTRIQPLVHGGGQEGGLRAGTENVAFAAALGRAAELAGSELPGSTARLAALRDLLHAELERRLPGRVHLNGHPSERLPGTLNISIDGTRGRALLAAVPGIAAATGSACHEGIDAPSPVLLAMGLPAERALAAVRLSLGRWSTEQEVRRAADLIADAATSA